MAQITKSRKAELNSLAETYGLVKGDHFYQDRRGFVIVNRAGIEKIQAHLKIRVEYEVAHHLCDEVRVVIKATAQMEDYFVQSFGESSPKNNSNAYPVAMAEKRALSRAVLKISGMYRVGAYGEDEMKTTEPITKASNAQKFTI